MLDKAIAITAEAFLGETDKGGQPYILHCLHVMNVISKQNGKDPELMQIAVMHDLVEDTKYSLIDLKKMGFSFRVVAGVASIMPFMAVVANPEVVENNKYLLWAYLTFGFNSLNSFLVFLGFQSYLLDSRREMNLS